MRQTGSRIPGRDTPSQSYVSYEHETPNSTQSSPRVRESNCETEEQPIVQGKFDSRNESITKMTRKHDLNEQTHIDMVYGLLDSQIRKQLDRKSVASLDQLLRQARAIEESTSKESITDDADMQAKSKYSSCLFHRDEDTKLLQLIEKEQAVRESKQIGQPCPKTQDYNFITRWASYFDVHKSDGFLLPLKILGRTGTGQVEMRYSWSYAGLALQQLFRKYGMHVLSRKKEPHDRNPDQPYEDIFVRVPVKLFDQSICADFSIAWNYEQTILGIDFIRQSGLVIDYNNKLCYFPDNMEKKYPLLTKPVVFYTKQANKKDSDEKKDKIDTQEDYARFAGTPFLEIGLLGGTATALLNIHENGCFADHSLLRAFEEYAIPVLTRQKMTKRYDGPTQIQTYVTVPVQIFDKMVTTEFLLKCNKMARCILGMDFIRDAGLVIDLNNWCCYFAENSKEKHHLLTEYAPFKSVMQSSSETSSIHDRLSIKEEDDCADAEHENRIYCKHWSKRAAGPELFIKIGRNEDGE